MAIESNNPHLIDPANIKKLDQFLSDLRNLEYIDKVIWPTTPDLTVYKDVKLWQEKKVFKETPLRYHDPAIHGTEKDKDGNYVKYATIQQYQIIVKSIFKEPHNTKKVWIEHYLDKSDPQNTVDEVKYVADTPDKLFAQALNWTEPVAPEPTFVQKLQAEVEALLPLPNIFGVFPLHVDAGAKSALMAAYMEKDNVKSYKYFNVNLDSEGAIQRTPVTYAEAQEILSLVRPQ